MNSIREISRRLLRLYPVQLLRDHFGKQALSQDHILKEIGNEYSSDAIKQFAFSSIGYTKQHVYVLDTVGVPRFDMDAFSKSKPDYIWSENGYTVWSYMLDFEVDVLVKLTKSFVSIQNLWPVSIHFKTGQVIIKITIMDRYYNYFGESKVVALGQTFTEKDIRDKIFASLSDNRCLPSVADLTKGAKHLLDNEIYNCLEVRYKKSRSTSTETLDKDMMMKHHLPEEYKVMMRSPLQKTIFTYIPRDGVQMPAHFRVEPEKGEIAFSIYPPSGSANSETIKLILDNN